MDYIVGNTGRNTLYQPNGQYPIYITAKDFDNNGHYVGIPSLYLPDRNGVKKEFPAQSRDDITNQLSSMKRKFANYKILCAGYDGRCPVAGTTEGGITAEGHDAAILFPPQ